MAKRSIILLTALVLSYIGMVWYISHNYPEQSNLVHYIAFGVALICAGVAGIFFSHLDIKVKGIIRIIKILFASYAVVFATWMLVSVILLPVLGYTGFELISNPMFGVFLLFGTLLLSPIVAKKLK